MVRPGRDALRPEVESKTRPGQWHQVDLGAYRGHGSCECEHFEGRLRKHVERGASGPSFRCQHVVEAREDLLERTIARLREILPEHIPAA